MSQTRIARLFEHTRAERRAAFIAYLTAGDPTPERTPALVEAINRCERALRAAFPQVRWLFFEPDTEK